MSKSFRLKALSLLLGVLSLGIVSNANAASYGNVFVYVGHSFDLPFDVYCNGYLWQDGQEVTVDWQIAGSTHTIQDLIPYPYMDFEVVHSFTVNVRNSWPLQTYVDQGSANCLGTPAALGQLTALNYPWIGALSETQDAPINALIPDNTQISGVPLTLTTYLARDVDDYSSYGQPGGAYTLGNDGIVLDDTPGTVAAAGADGCAADAQPAACYTLSVDALYPTSGVKAVHVDGYFTSVALSKDFNITIADGTPYIAKANAIFAAAFVNLP